jgi:hypothetical protein
VKHLEVAGLRIAVVGRNQRAAQDRGNRRRDPLEYRRYIPCPGERLRESEERGGRRCGLALLAEQLRVLVGDALWDASTSKTRWSSASNWSTPRFDRTITPVTRSPTFMGTARIDSSISVVPSIWTPMSSCTASAA